jgi:hypothetical protein
VNGTTEFLAKSLIGAGVFLAIPAVLAVLVALLSIALSLPHIRLAEALWSLGIVTFCSSGFYLLIRTARFVRAPDGTLAPSWLWPLVTVYLLIIISAAAYWLLRSYSLARIGELRDWGGDEVDPQIFVVPAVALLIPVWAVILSCTLWVRYAFNRDA